MIEDSELFPRSFGRDVVAGMLDLPPEQMRGGRRGQGGKVSDQDRVKHFVGKWGPYDWTRDLEGGS